jgi:transcriptional regulator with XRE-family HTH domain
MATRIRDIRKARGLTLQALADRVGTTAQTIQRLETGNMTVSVDWLSRIGRALQLSPAQLLVGSTGQHVPVIGSVKRDGRIESAASNAAPSPLVLDVPADDPVAVAVTERLGPYEAGTMLIGARLPQSGRKAADGRDCLVGTSDGRMLLRRILDHRTGASTLLTSGTETRGAVERHLEIAWVAPLVLAIRFL